MARPDALRQINPSPAQRVLCLRGRDTVATMLFQSYPLNSDIRWLIVMRYEKETSTPHSILASLQLPRRSLQTPLAPRSSCASPSLGSARRRDGFGPRHGADWRVDGIYDLRNGSFPVLTRRPAVHCCPAAVRGRQGRGRGRGRRRRWELDRAQDVTQTVTLRRYGPGYVVGKSAGVFRTCHPRTAVSVISVQVRLCCFLFNDS